MHCGSSSLRTIFTWYMWRCHFYVWILLKNVCKILGCIIFYVFWLGFNLRFSPKYCAWRVASIKKPLAQELLGLLFNCIPLFSFLFGNFFSVQKLGWQHEYVNNLPVLGRAPVPRKYHALVPRAKHEELRVMVLSGYLQGKLKPSLRLKFSVSGKNTQLMRVPVLLRIFSKVTCVTEGIQKIYLGDDLNL